ncbi:FAD-binding oxidoreductase [uncultured Sunxiuqinia sp.]|uniref:NAD(P)/FAD-dependent oxidoreductase n=1 Tax=uncultured Sunxiuqinia sp. TaxID=1573825 RepID=UPI0030D7CA5A
MKVDYLIIGQGLAGSLLVYELQKAGKTCFVLDDPTSVKASEVAAGVVNPVVFRRLTKSWLVDDLYPQLLDTYAELEERFGIKLFHPLQIKKVLGKGEAEFWQKKWAENKLQPYLEAKPDRLPHPFLQADFGIGTVAQSGRVDLKQLVQKMNNELQQQQCIRFEKLNLNALKLEETQVCYQDIRAEKILFCEGHAVSENPFFKALRFRHTKGEVLRIKTNNYNGNFILNKAMFLMPEGEQFFRLGATYDWKDLSLQTTTKAREKLEEKLVAVFTDQFVVIDHQTGIRPTTHDRRPVIGLHPEYPQVGIFNGLGSKGAMLGPYFARQFAAFLCGEISELHPEATINRYFINKKGS